MHPAATKIFPPIIFLIFSNVLVAQTFFGNAAEAKRLMARVTQIAGRNYHLIPEIISIEEEDYKGSLPMVGYGAGAYVLGIWAVCK